MEGLTSLSNDIVVENCLVDGYVKAPKLKWFRKSLSLDKIILCMETGKIKFFKLSAFSSPASAKLSDTSFHLLEAALSCSLNSYILL